VRFMVLEVKRWCLYKKLPAPPSLAAAVAKAAGGGAGMRADSARSWKSAEFKRRIGPHAGPTPGGFGDRSGKEGGAGSFLYRHHRFTSKTMNRTEGRSDKMSRGRPLFQK